MLQCLHENASYTSYTLLIKLNWITLKTILSTMFQYHPLFGSGKANSYIAQLFSSSMCVIHTSGKSFSEECYHPGKECAADEGQRLRKQPGGILCQEEWNSLQPDLRPLCTALAKGTTEGASAGARGPVSKVHAEPEPATPCQLTCEMWP